MSDEKKIEVNEEPTYYHNYDPDGLYGECPYVGSFILPEVYARGGKKVVVEMRIVEGENDPYVWFFTALNGPREEMHCGWTWNGKELLFEEGEMMFRKEDEEKGMCIEYPFPKSFYEIIMSLKSIRISESHGDYQLVFTTWEDIDYVFWAYTY